jgi:hypothetical protein
VTVAAQPPADPMEVCSRKEDVKARLECFDQEMKRRHAPAAKPEEKRTDENFGLEGDALRHRLKEEGVVKPPPPQPLSSQVVQAKESPNHLFTFTLNNGQVWEQTETRQGFYLAPKEAVTISAGTLGSYFLETPKKEYVRVRRVK